MLRATILLSMALLSACSMAPKSIEGLANYDFGLTATQKEANPRLELDLVIAPVSAPAWMENSGI